MKKRNYINFFSLKPVLSNYFTIFKWGFLIFCPIFFFVFFAFFPVIQILSKNNPSPFSWAYIDLIESIGIKISSWIQANLDEKDTKSSNTNYVTEVGEILRIISSFLSWPLGTITWSDKLTSMNGVNPSSMHQSKIALTKYGFVDFIINYVRIAFSEGDIASSNSGLWKILSAYFRSGAQLDGSLML